MVSFLSEVGSRVRHTGWNSGSYSGLGHYHRNHGGSSGCPVIVHGQYDFVVMVWSWLGVAYLVVLASAGDLVRLVRHFESREAVKEISVKAFDGGVKVDMSRSGWVWLRGEREGGRGRGEEELEGKVMESSEWGRIHSGKRAIFAPWAWVPVGPPLSTSKGKCYRSQ